MNRYRRFLPFFLIFALLIPSASALAEGFGYYYDAIGEAWFVTGTVDMDIYQHGDRDEMIEYHYAKLSPEAYGFMRRLVSGDGAPYDEYGDNQEIVIYAVDEGIDLDEYIGERITFAGDAFEGMTIYHRRSIVVEVTAILDAPARDDTPVAGEYLDYLEIIGLSPETIRGMYGQPDEIEDNVAEGERYMEYHYRNASISFAPDGRGNWAVDGATAHRPDSAIRVGDVYVSMIAKYAQQALEKNGYYLEMINSEGCAFYTNDFVEGGFVLVMIWEDGGQVSEISGWQGRMAEQLFAAGGGI